MFRFDSCLKAVAVFAVILPLIILGHEGSHYLVARLLGYRPLFAYDMNEMPPLPATAAVYLDLAWICLAGPVFHLLIGFLGMAVLWRHGRTNPHSLTAWMGSALAFGGSMPLTHLASFIINPNNIGHLDEHNVARGFGWSSWSAQYVVWFFAATILYLLCQHHRKQQMALPFCIGAAAGILSGAFYFQVAGPFFLPHKH